MSQNKDIQSPIVLYVPNGERQALKTLGDASEIAKEGGPGLYFASKNETSGALQTFRNWQIHQINVGEAERLTRLGLSINNGLGIVDVTIHSKPCFDRWSNLSIYLSTSPLNDESIGSQYSPHLDIDGIRDLLGHENRFMGVIDRFFGQNDSSYMSRAEFAARLTNAEERQKRESGNGPKAITPARAYRKSGESVVIRPKYQNETLERLIAVP